MLTIIIAVLFIFLLFYYYYFNRDKGFPPGPYQFPIIGTLHITRDIPHLACTQLKKEYGPIIGMKAGSERDVVIHGAKLIREALSENVFSGRFSSEATGFLLGDKYGILQATGEVWSEQRRFAMRTLRDFGFGRSSMEEMIREEALELCDWFRKQNGAPIEFSKRVSLAVVNSLWQILTGERFDHDDKYLTNILEQLESTQKVLLDSGTLRMSLLFFYPKISKLFPNFSGWNKLVQASKEKNELFDRMIQEHIDTLQPGSPRDFVDVYLEEINNTQSKTSSFHSSIGRNSLRSVLSDLFLAGSDTTSVTLNWTMLYLLHYPKVQEKVHKEIDSVVGRTRLPCLNDRKSLPYTEALIMEVLRISSIVIMGVSHSTTDDLEFHGYSLKKGTLVTSNLYEAHHDPEVWEGDPEIFRPERFLNPDGSCIQRHESLIPFSVGKRACMGEQLARDSLFVFITMILQSFKAEIPAGDKVPTLEPLLRKITLQPQKYKISMISRS